MDGDGDLSVDWVPVETSIGGEFRLAFPTCGVGHGMDDLGPARSTDRHVEHAHRHELRTSASHVSIWRTAAASEVSHPTAACAASAAPANDV